MGQFLSLRAFPLSPASDFSTTPPASLSFAALVDRRGGGAASSSHSACGLATGRGALPDISGARAAALVGSLRSRAFEQRTTAGLSPDTHGPFPLPWPPTICAGRADRGTCPFSSAQCFA